MGTNTSVKTRITSGTDKAPSSFASGKKHVGEWKNGLPNGLGVQTYADGRVKKGIWKNGKFLYAKKP